MLLLSVAAMLAQVSAAPAAPQQQAPVQQQAAKQKPKQICEMIEVTGSRSKRRVCHEEGGNLNLGPGISSTSYDSGSSSQDSNRN